MLEALKAITSYAAYQYHEEEEKGTIAVGKYADFVVLDKDPLEADAETLSDIQVLMTLKENEVIYRREAIQNENGSEGETSHE